RRVSRHSVIKDPGQNGGPAAVKAEAARGEADNRVIWVIGLSGSHNATLCDALRSLLKPSMSEVVLIDGETVGQVRGDGLGGSEEDRIVQIKRLQKLAKTLSEQGFVVLVAALYSNPELLAWNRKNLQNYHEVYLEVSVEPVRCRDAEKLYDGTAGRSVEVDIPWHAPESPDIMLSLEDADTPKALAQRVIDSISRFERVPAVI
ncbi:MAG: adenylyl-sulfate kinase, partial [Chloroflexi bacterium]|nr:adenylyl-sulfate kinase [Chloroflexota bacterium]